MNAWFPTKECQKILCEPCDNHCEPCGKKIKTYPLSAPGTRKEERQENSCEPCGKKMKIPVTKQ